MAAKTDNFQSPDYFQLDELLTDEHKLIRESVRNYVKKEISPIIEDYAQRAEFRAAPLRRRRRVGVVGEHEQVPPPERLTQPRRPRDRHPE